MKIFATAMLCASLIYTIPSAVSAGQLIAKVDISEQTMRVYRNGKQIHKWPVSTARKGKITPRGAWRAKWLSKNHKSSLYNNAPMPHSIFFRGNYAIHGTNQIRRLGRPASAGCIRLHPSNAARLFAMTQQVGLRNMKVVVQN
ncbi:L,D-transpeptidase [Sulfitobacter sp. F26169L]|uniref:L,D-transpeptidase n=1 Tax=Sulfitobacter sp. F26169L TaxID=2996015 RepID=UPI002260ED3D|nr:L,D-transpeptidase [Sulfitobacter sp. F26169L]MCX7565526.1 L,D-transpeptidase [Sulfitobacter sp. F26169L]